MGGVSDVSTAAATPEGARGSAARGCAYMFVVAGVLGAGGVFALRLTSGPSLPTTIASSTAGISTNPDFPRTGNMVAAPSAFPAPTGTAAFATLAPGDQRFVDIQGGTGWGNRCWDHIKAQEYLYARAACTRAFAMNPKAPYPRAWLLYNMGLIEAHDGRPEIARAYYMQSLELRPVNDPGISDVQRSLGALGPAPSAR